VLLCFCDDCSAHGGAPKFAPPLLIKAFGLDDGGEWDEGNAGEGRGRPPPAAGAVHAGKVAPVGGGHDDHVTAVETEAGAERSKSAWR
jgi:hypothetical protein